MSGDDAHTSTVRAAKPVSVEELADLLRTATEERTPVSVWGGGTHRDIGYQPSTDSVVSVSALAGIVDWEPDDLTVVVGAGTRVADLEAELAARGQSAVLAEQPGSATVGGAVATATSGYRRLRYGPTRDRVLEVSAVTGDGRVVKGGGRVVKNVTGYDLPRLYTGSFAALGVITSVCLKLWPLTEAKATVKLAELPPPEAVHRPLALIQTEQDVLVLLAGTAAEVEDLTRRLGGESAPGLAYPDVLEGPVVWSLRVRPGLLAAALSHLPQDVRFIAQHGVGEVSFEVDEAFEVDDLRTWAEAEGGIVVRLRGHTRADPWGTPPAGLDLQRRVVAAFDPARVLEPGRLPGGI